jgi:hypothetical protein
VDVSPGDLVAVFSGLLGGVIGVFSSGPKGVGEVELFGLGVTVGPTALGIAVMGPVQAVRRKRNASKLAGKQ